MRYSLDVADVAPDAAGTADATHPDCAVDGEPMRVLVVAHDFPPIASPQALRTARLVDGLLAAGCSVHVLAAGAGDEPDRAAPRLRVTRCAASPVDRVVAMRHARRAAGVAAKAPAGGQALNWKGRLAARAKAALGGVAFPGLSRFWLIAATPRLRGLLQTFRPARVVLCHEPAAALLLSPLVASAGVPWIAELGDPVLACYTPRRWRQRAHQLQRQVCREAAHVVLSSQATLDHLVQEAGLDRGRATVVYQGHEPIVKRGASVPGRLRLVYTGRFYPFRDPRPLYAAVARVPEVDLVVAQPQGIARGGLPRNVSVVGELSHAQALELQASADVLVNIGNDGLPQLPGKFFEYLGLPTPILHLTNARDDEQALLLSELRRGWVVENEEAEIVARLRALLQLHVGGRLHDGLDLSEAAAARFAWDEAGRRFAALVAEARR